MSDSENHNVTGIDGIQPVYNPKDLWKTWSLDELYMGQQGKDRYVPKVNDWAVNVLTGARWRVSAVDQITLVPTLVPMGNDINMALSAEDLLFAQSPGWPSEAYRCYLDTTVFPFRMDVDNFLAIRQVNAAYVKVIYGPLYGNHEVISKIYDNAGNFVSENVGLSLTALEAGWTNYSWKCVNTFFTNRMFQDGDMVTVVVYSQDGHVLSFTNLAVVNSNFLRDLNAPRRVIKHISARSPFLSETDGQKLLVPLNWNQGSINVEGVVHYNDGTELVLPIDGAKFQLGGWRSILSSIPGQQFDLVLRYMMDDTETAAPEINAFGNSIPFPMRAEIVEASNSYTLKLHPLLIWNPNTSAYDIRWFMINLDRDVVRDVTSYVQVAANSPAFNGALFGVVQRIQVSLRLRDVVSTWKPFIHTQIAEFTLYGTPGNYQSPWAYKASTADELPYGGSVFARKVGPKAVTMLAGATTQQEWLTALYQRLAPLVATPEDTQSYIQPTHVSVEHDNQSVIVPVADWDDPVNFLNDVDLHDTLHLTWMRETGSGFIYLAKAGLIVQNSV
jgi:hypothetical protein